VVEEAVRDAGLLGDVADARGVVALAGEDPDGRVEQEPSLLLLRGGPLYSHRRSLKSGEPMFMVGGAMLPQRMPQTAR
jgi:hypothetical protein